MRRALGPFLTTGVALTAAAVVVANPVAPPSRDMQISTTQLSTSPDLLSPSDKSLLSALTPRLSAESIAPALAQILAALAADADRISREVTSEVGPEVLAAPALTEQTAYRPEAMAAPFIESPNATPIAASTGFASAVVSSDVVQVLNGLVADTGYLGGKVVEASVALVQVIIRVPEFVVTAVLDLLNGDVVGAVDTVKAVIKAFFGPGLIILDGIRDVLYGRTPPPVPPPTAAKRLVEQITGTTPEQPATGGTARPTRSDKAESGRKQVEAPSAAALRPIATPSKPASSTDQTPTSAKSPTSKPTSGSTRATAGSARESKSAASASSSAD